MMRKLKFALAALLGFSAACSSVKNTPRRTEPTEPTRRDTPDGCRETGEALDTVTCRPRIMVMYGVRPPEEVRRNRLPKSQPSDAAETDLRPTAPTAGPETR